MSGQVKVTPHPADATIRLIQFRRSPTDQTVEAEITFNKKKIVSTKATDMLQASYKALEIKAKLLSMIEMTGSVVLRRPAGSRSGPHLCRSRQDRDGQARQGLGAGRAVAGT